MHTENLSFGGNPRQTTMSKGKRGKKRISKPLQSPESDSEEQVLPEKPEAAPPTETSSASSEPSAKSNSFLK